MRSSRPARSCTGSHPSGTRSRTSSRRSQRRTTGAQPSEHTRRRRDLRPRLPALRGGAARTLVAPSGYLAGWHPHLARARPRHGREDRALAPDRPRARADGDLRRSRGLPRLRAHEPRRLRTAVVRRVLRLRHPPPGAVRGRRGTTARLPRPARRRPLALCRPPDHAEGLHRITVGGVLHDLGPRRLRARSGPLLLECPRCPGLPVVARRQLGRPPPLAPRRRARRGLLHDTLAARRVLHDTPRVRVDRSSRRPLHRLGDRRHRRGQLQRRPRGHPFAGVDAPGARTTSSTGPMAT